jgi:class 3 adenylate cyclase/tetratricopeptide (TPR) repeat protein
VRCDACQHENPADARFCGGCGRGLELACAACGRSHPRGTRFCTACGAVLGVPEPGTAPGLATAPPPAAAAESEPEGERRHLTVLFCDLAGSTQLGERLDPEELHGLYRTYRERCAEVVARYDGHVAQYLGDGILVYFGYPSAHEDDPERAVRAGLEIADTLERLEPGAALRLSARVGIHSGPVVVSETGPERREKLAHGHTTNLAARLQQLAEPNTVVVSGATLRLVQGLFLVQDLGLQTLKGVSEPVPVSRVLRRSGVRSRLDVAAARGLTPLVGRDQELGLLLDRFEQAQEGAGNAVILSGEAGIGKSRLMQAFRQRLADSAHSWLECRGSPYARDSALQPVIDLLGQALEAAEDDTPAEKARRLETGLAHAGFALGEALPLLASLLGLPLPEGYAPASGTPEAQRRRTLELLLAWILDLGREQPLVLLVEDLHWADPSSLELLTLLVEQVPTGRLLLLLTHRPGFAAPWGLRSHLTPIVLGRLSRRHGVEMVASIAGTTRLPEELVSQVVARADGVPLFLEELTKSVLESGGARKGAGELAIPETLQDSLMARLDRLSPVKEVAQLAATLGREFSYELLQAVSPLEEGELREGLARLVEAELLYQRGVVPQASYVFKHALVQETAYQSLLRARRQQFHRRIAEVLEARFAALAEVQPELVAHHWTEAGLAEQALEWWQRAGQRSLVRSANVEAARHLGRSLDQIAELPPGAERGRKELQARMPLAMALIASRGYGVEEVGSNFARARELCQELGEAPELFPILYGLFLFYLVQADREATGDLIDQCFRLADRTQSRAFVLEANNGAGIRAVHGGEHQKARSLLERSFALWEPALGRANAFLFGQDPGASNRSWTALNEWYQGFPDRAAAHAERALAIARESAHPFSQAMALVLAAILYAHRRDWGRARGHAEAAVTLAREQGFPLWLGAAMLVHVRAIVEDSGASPELVQQLDEVLSRIRATGTQLFLPHILSQLAEIRISLGEGNAALSLLDEGLAAARRGLDACMGPELLRLRGEALRVSGDVTGAEQAFQEGLALAREREARSLELRTASSLARLWQRGGRVAQARDLLAPIYGWFTEGFDTADLREAKALLDALA